eukprot:GAHX01000767.1.p1 GENE.GAHX01000767.1~~GAHX01000767.1.p1  ORF type:complete len:526 (+),score=112.16 GAHX01000767.1:189-1766(+)
MKSTNSKPQTTKTTEHKSALKAIKKANLSSLIKSLKLLKEDKDQYSNIVTSLLIEAAKNYDLDIFKYLEQQLPTNSTKDGTTNEKYETLATCAIQSLTHSSDEIASYIIVENKCILEKSVDNKLVIETLIDLNLFEVYKAMMESLRHSECEATIEHFFDTFSFKLPGFNILDKLLTCKKNEMFKISYDLLLTLLKYRNGLNYTKDFYKKLLSDNISIIDMCFKNRNFEILSFLISNKSAPFYREMISQSDKENNTILHRVASTFFSTPNAFGSISTLLSDPSLSFPTSALNSAQLSASEIYHSLLTESQNTHRNSMQQKEADISRIKELKQLKQYRKSIECDVIISIWLKENHLGNLIEKFGIAKVKNLETLTKEKLLTFLNEAESKMVLNALEMKNKLEMVKKRENENYLKRKKKVKKLLRMYQVDKEEDLPDGVVDHFIDDRNNNNNNNNNNNRNNNEREEFEESLVVENSMNDNYLSAVNINRGIRNFRDSFGRNGHTRMVTLVIMGYILFFLMLWVRRMFK